VNLRNLDVRIGEGRSVGLGRDWFRRGALDEGEHFGSSLL
jgi:hypothetical protein